MGTVDLKALERACMADLGRARQDELPLSDRELRGPSFVPTRNNTARHIPAAYKEGLKSKWSVQIQDEEAAQMEGLANDDARPWATKRGLNTRPPEAAAARPLQAFSGNSKRPVSVASMAPVGRLGGLIPPGTQPSEASSPHIKPDGLEKARVSPAGLRKPVPAQTKPAALDPPRKEPPVSPHKSVCSGNCQLQPAAGTSPVMVQFEMRINNSPPGAALVFALPCKDRKVHDVLDLKNPVIEDQCCVVASNDGNTKYWVKLETIELTREFNKYLECLRKLVLMQNARNSRAGIPSPPVSKVPSTPATQRAACHQDAGSPITAGPLSIGATGNAQERLKRLIHRLVPGFAGCELSEKEAERFNGDYLNMIQTLEGIELQLKPQEPPSSSLASLKELEAGQNPTPLRYTLDEMKSLNTHTTLRTKQPLGVESLSIKGLMAAKPAAKSPSRAQLPNFAECRDWLFGSSTNIKPLAKKTGPPTQQSTDAASSTLATGHLGWEALCADAAVCSAEPMEIGSSPTPNAAPPATKLAAPAIATCTTKPGHLHKACRPGLSTSRWA